MALDFSRCKQAFSDMKNKYYGECEVTETIRTPQDLEDSKTQFYEGNHKIGPSNCRCLIEECKPKDKKRFSTYSMLKNIRHPALITFQNFYDDNGNGKIVLSWVDSSLSAWMKSEAKDMCFKSSVHGSVPSPMLRQMILDLCRGVQHLFKNKLYPANISLEDLFVLKRSAKDRRLQLLVQRVHHIIEKAEAKDRMVKLWSQVKKTVHEICKKPDLSPVTHRFIEYIGNDVSLLEAYPDIWTDDQKSSYLLLIIAASRDDVLEKIKDINLCWPKNPVGDKEGVPALLDALIEHDLNRRKPSDYKITKFYDYLRLCRTVIKHFPSLQQNVILLQDSCPRPEDFLRRMEKWEPQIWCLLYDKLGSLDD